jgi:hypothetical protein
MSLDQVFDVTVALGEVRDLGDLTVLPPGRNN